MIGVQQRVVVSVDDCLAFALAQFWVFAGGREALELRRITFEIAGAMVSQLMQHNHLIAFGRRKLRGKPLDQDLIHAALVIAQLCVFGVGQALARQSVAHALAAGLVVAPQGGHARMVEYMQQGLVAADFLFIVVAAAVGREHARQRYFGTGPASAHLRKVDEPVDSGQFGRGLARIAVQAPVLGARGFSDHQYQQSRFAAAGACGLSGVGSDGQQRPLGAGRRRQQHFGQGDHVIGRSHQVAHFMVVPDQR